MPKIAERLTERRLRAMKPGDWLSDSEVRGLGARRHRSGVSFVYRYMLAGRREVAVLGEWLDPQSIVQRPAGDFNARPRYDATETMRRLQGGADANALLDIVTAGGTPLLSLADARELAQAMRARLKRGENPKADEKASVRDLTLQGALDLYMDSGKTRAERTDEDYRNVMDRYMSDWLARPLMGITPQEVHARHRKIGTKNGRYAANQAMRVLRAIYRRARKVYPALPPSPVEAVDFYEERRREAAIPRDQLPQWWREVQAFDNAVRRDWYIVALFTGLRRETVGNIRVDDVDLAARTLRVPKPKGGERRAFTLPLPDFLVRVIRRRIAGNAALLERQNAWRDRKKLPPLEPSPWLFPAHSKSGHVEEPKVSAGDGFTVKFTPHGLRNTYASAATAAGVHPYAMKLLLNHKLPRSDVTAGYVQVDVEALRPEQERIAAKLREWLEPAQDALPAPALALPAPEHAPAA